MQIKTILYQKTNSSTAMISIVFSSLIINDYDNHSTQFNYHDYKYDINNTDENMSMQKK